MVEKSFHSSKTYSLYCISGFAKNDDLFVLVESMYICRCIFEVLVPCESDGEPKLNRCQSEARARERVFPRRGGEGVSGGNSSAMYAARAALAWPEALGLALLTPRRAFAAPKVSYNNSLPIYMYGKRSTVFRFEQYWTQSNGRNLLYTPPPPIKKRKATSSKLQELPSQTRFIIATFPQYSVGARLAIHSSLQLLLQF